MAYTGKIYIADHEGMQVGIGQDVTVLHDSNGYAAYLVTPDGNQRIGDYFETEAACVTALKEGGTTTIVVDDDV